MKLLKRASLFLLGVASLFLTACKSNLERYQDFKKEHPTETRGDFIEQELSGTEPMQKPYVHVPDEHVQRTESVYNYHYGWDNWKMDWRWHWGWHDVNRDNTPQEDSLDLANYKTAVEQSEKNDLAHSRYLKERPEAIQTIAALANSSMFNHVAGKDDRVDSLDLETFKANADTLAQTAVRNNVTFALAKKDPQGKQRLYEDAYKNVLSQTRNNKNTVVYVPVK